MATRLQQHKNYECHTIASQSQTQVAEQSGSPYLKCVCRANVGRLEITKDAKL